MFGVSWTYLCVGHCGDVILYREYIFFCTKMQKKTTTMLSTSLTIHTTGVIFVAQIVCRVVIIKLITIVICDDLAHAFTHVLTVITWP